MTAQKFRFYTPVNISKAKDKEGKEIMRLGGIASTADEDSDGENLMPAGFDISTLKKSGIVNWHHQAKSNPEAIIGEPSKVELTKKGLYIESDLYGDSDLAQKVYKLAQVLEKNSKTRRLGYSIEGRVLERDPLNKAIVTKAEITGVAITHMPKNPKTFAEIIKGKIDDDDSIEEKEEEGIDDEIKKEMSAGSESGKAVTKESVDKKIKNLTTFSKGETFTQIFEDVHNVDINTAKQIYSLIEKSSQMKNKGKITSDDIVKAYGALGIDVPANLQKSADAEAIEETPATEVETVEKGQTETTTEVAVEETIEKGGDEPKGLGKYFDKLEKAMSVQMRAVGILVQNQHMQIEGLSDEIGFVKAQNQDLMEELSSAKEEIAKAQETIEGIGNTTAGRKSTTRAIERFDKGNEGEEIQKSKNTLSKVKDKKTILHVLDTFAFEKGYDDEFSKACTVFETSGQISDAVVNRLKLEKGITIV